MNKTLAMAALVGAAAIVAGCATTPSPADLDRQALAMMKASFRDEGIAKADRLNQDLAQQACSSDKAPAEAVARQIQAEALATIRQPAGGKYLGDWREGEKLAQSGRGMTWTDASAAPTENGGGCYNCHQISKQEISFGTIGPSLYNYGKLRGVTELKGPVADAMLQYTWGRLNNSWAYTACSNMPRFGYKHLLNEAQMMDVMALLLDPASPVNAQ
jgi:sulfur-oxidizing protein SoxX